MNTSEYFSSSWNFNPIVIGACAVAAILYGYRLRWRFAARSLYFVAALAIGLFALTSPLNALAAGYLFSAHMLQHMLLLLIVPLFVLLALPPSGEENAPTSAPRFATALSWIGGVGAMWVWHQRTLCDLATLTASGRAVQIVSLLALGALFWRPVFGPSSRSRLSPMAGVVYLFGACVACSVLGILITFAPSGSVCPVYLHPPTTGGVLDLIRNDWGLTAAKDQQIGGLLMWIPGCGIYLAGTMALFARWYRSAETTRRNSHVTPIG
jgi:cytochrome c oxidase assembly factor CtaG